jgi:hypothetical protein
MPLLTNDRFRYWKIRSTSIPYPTPSPYNYNHISNNLVSEG